MDVVLPHKAVHEVSPYHGSLLGVPTRELGLQTTRQIVPEQLKVPHWYNKEFHPCHRCFQVSIAQSVPKLKHTSSVIHFRCRGWHIAYLRTSVEAAARELCNIEGIINITRLSENPQILSYCTCTSYTLHLVTFSSTQSMGFAILPNTVIVASIKINPALQAPSNWNYWSIRYR